MATTHTGIAWTDRTWNPTRGCRRVSPGCENCYAERQAHRFAGPGLPYEGLVALGKNGPRWTGKGLLSLKALAEPLSWKKPARVFVDSMSDLFFEAFSNEEIAAVFGVMAACPYLTFQVLTKRAERMKEWFSWVEEDGVPGDIVVSTCASNYIDVDQLQRPWPLPNVWLGVSVESQRYADERIPELLRTPAAVRFVSYEPALEEVDFDPPVCPDCRRRQVTLGEDGATPFCVECGTEMCFGNWLDPIDGISWVIVGGESGPGARPFDVRWAEGVIRQCRDTDVACFVKQLGGKPVDVPREFGPGSYPRTMAGGYPWPAEPVCLKHKSGADPSEWLEYLRVQEFPTPEAES